MFCTSCGKEIPDGSTVCKECGKPLPGAVGASEQEKPKSAIDVNVGAFIKDFFKDPVQAVISRSADSYMVWGLISLGAFIFVYFFRYLFDDLFDFGVSFGMMFSLACGLAALIFGLLLFQNVLKLEKRSLPSIVAVVGLSMAPVFAMFIIGGIMDVLFMDTALLAIMTNAMLTVGYIFSALILDKFYFDEKAANYSKSTLLIAISFACFLLVQGLFTIVVWKSM